MPLSHKVRRQEFIRRYFPFPDNLEFAIRQSEPSSLVAEFVKPDPLAHLQRYDRSDRLIKLLEKHGYNKHYNWAYKYNNDYRLNDWCSLFWLPGEGLKVHFEFMNVDFNTNVSQETVEMSTNAWEFLFSKRKVILSNFCGGRFVEKYRQEDFCVVLLPSINL